MLAKFWEDFFNLPRFIFFVFVLLFLYGVIKFHPIVSSIVIALVALSYYFKRERLKREALAKNNAK